MRTAIRTLFAVMILAVAIPSAIPAIAAPAPQISAARGNLAAGGYDVTAYFTKGAPVRGSAAHQIRWKGAIWRFASAETLAAFKKSPERYAPQFGGYCAWAVSQHYLAPGDPNYWKVVDDKLYLNANARAKELWEADQTDAIERGHANWPLVLERNQDAS